MDKKLLTKIKRNDKLAHWGITAGGMFTIVCMLTILILIASTALPLFESPEINIVNSIDMDRSQGNIIASGLDDYIETGYVVYSSGLVHFYHLNSGALLKSLQFPQVNNIKYLQPITNHQYSIITEANKMGIASIKFSTEFDNDGKRSIVHNVAFDELEFDSTVIAKEIDIKMDEYQSIGAALLDADNKIHVLKQVKTENLFGDETVETYSSQLSDESLDSVITAFCIDDTTTHLYLGSDDGKIIVYRIEIEDEEAILTLKTTEQVNAENKPITSLAMVLGSVSVAVGDATGQLSTWFFARGDQGEKFVKAHILERHATDISKIVPFRRNKSLLSLNKNGQLHIDHMTSERHLLSLTEGAISIFGCSNRGDGLVTINENSQLDVWKLKMNHPEISWDVLFGKVWYEGHAQPEYVWQSSSGSDDYEAKFSVVPLILGTFKGTFYAMIFSVPLAIFSAIYVSQFAGNALKSWIKPIMEIMAAVPSVVVGFLIALWLAPLLKEWIVSFFVMFFVGIIILVLFITIWSVVERKPVIRRFWKGREGLIMIPLMILGIYLSAPLGIWAENILFNGDFEKWIYETVDLRYDQRNAIIIAFGLGIAVIPVIFSIAEDALSSVPKTLTAASLALGASRWQTVRNIVLLSASPGIFASVILGFARAVGETMIVLMATGNTPLMSWSPFNGMRTLSANIAVEIPEAPVGGTLYRILFLCAVLLFLLTFVLNTGAELIRQSLRKKYGRF